VSALRLTIIGIPLAIVALARRLPRYPLRTELLLGAAGAALAAHFATWIASLQDTAVATSTLLVCTTPLWLGVYEHVARKQPMPRLYVAVFALAAIGLIAIVGVPTGSGRNDLRGDVLALAGAIAMAVYLEIVRALRVPSTLAVVARTYPIAGLLLVIATVVTRERPPSLHATSAWLGIFAMAFISQGIGHTGVNAAIRRLPTRFIATTTLAEPVIAACLAAVLFGERLGPLAIAGGMLIFAALALAVRVERLVEPLL